MDRLLEEAGERAAAAGVAAVEAEDEFVEVEVELARADPLWCVPRSQRSRSEATRWTRGITTWAGSPLAELFVGWWIKPASPRPL